MRNLFDQYTQPENRVTHALLTALHEDRTLLNTFLSDVVGVTPPRKDDLQVLEQCYPDEDEEPETELERRGVPDGWIVTDDGWCVIIESKVTAPLTADQIARHRRTAEQRGFRSIAMVAITARPTSHVPDGTVLILWRDVYAWLRRNMDRSAWARRAAEYMEIAEAKLIDGQTLVEGTLTCFTGFPFGRERPFTYLEGKRLLGLALGELRVRDDLQKIGMNPRAPGRPAITGRNEHGVWDFLSLGGSASVAHFTEDPHLTLGINAHAVEAMVTVPHRVNSVFRRRLADLGEEGFRELVSEIACRMAPVLKDHASAVPWFRGVQRRYPSQKAAPLIDAKIEFDLRTALTKQSPVKTQPNWLSAAFASFANKCGANYQIQVGMLFPFDRCTDLDSPKAIDLIARAWLGCAPLITTGMGRSEG